MRHLDALVRYRPHLLIGGAVVAVLVLLGYVSRERERLKGFAEVTPDLYAAIDHQDANSLFARTLEEEKQALKLTPAKLAALLRWHAEVTKGCKAGRIESDPGTSVAVADRWYDCQAGQAFLSVGLWKTRKGIRAAAVYSIVDSGISAKYTQQVSRSPIEMRMAMARGYRKEAKTLESMGLTGYMVPAGSVPKVSTWEQAAKTQEKIAAKLREKALKASAPLG